MEQSNLSPRGYISTFTIINRWYLYTGIYGAIKSLASYDHMVVMTPGVKISKKCQGSFNIISFRALTLFIGPRFSYFVYGTNNSITVASKFAGPADLPTVNFEGPQAILWAIGQRARLILTPGWHTHYTKLSISQLSQL